MMHHLYHYLNLFLNLDYFNLDYLFLSHNINLLPKYVVVFLKYNLYQIDMNLHYLNLYSNSINILYKKMHLVFV